MGISSALAQELEAGVSIMYGRMRSLVTLRVDPREAYNLCVLEEDRTVMRRAYDLGMRSMGHRLHVNYKGDEFEAAIPAYPIEGAALLPPYVNELYVRDRLQGTQLATDLETTVERLIPIAKSWTVVQHLVQMLTRRCKSPKQLRYLMPGCVQLLVAAKEHKRADALRDPVSLNSHPALPPGTIQALIEANQLIARAALIKEGNYNKEDVVFAVRTKMQLPWGEMGYPQQVAVMN